MYFLRSRATQYSFFSIATLYRDTRRNTGSYFTLYVGLLQRQYCLGARFHAVTTHLGDIIWHTKELLSSGRCTKKSWPHQSELYNILEKIYFSLFIEHFLISMDLEVWSRHFPESGCQPFLSIIYTDRSSFLVTIRQFLYCTAGFLIKHVYMKKAGSFTGALIKDMNRAELF